MEPESCPEWHRNRMAASETRVLSGVGHHEKAETTARQPVIRRLCRFAARLNHLKRVWTEPPSRLKQYKYQFIGSSFRVPRRLGGGSEHPCSRQYSAAGSNREDSGLFSGRQPPDAPVKFPSIDRIQTTAIDPKRRGRAVAAGIPDRAARRPPSPHSTPLSGAAD